MDYTSFLTPTLGVGGIVVIAVVMLLRGDLVPRKQVDSLMATKDEQIAFYKSAHSDARQALAERDLQLTEMMLTARTTRRVLEALPDVDGTDHGGPHEVPSPQA